MVLLAGLVLVDADVVAVVAVAVGATGFSAFFGPAMGAYLPSLVRDESDLGPANTVYARLNEITLIIGPAIGAVVISVLDLSAAFLLDALSFAIAAAVLWTLPSSARRGGDDVVSDAAGQPPSEDFWGARRLVRTRRWRSWTVPPASCSAA